MKPGIHAIRAEQYHADRLVDVPSLSRGAICDLIYRSPLHCWWNHPRLNPDYRPEDNRKFDLGSAAHDALLGGMENVQPVTADDWRTKAARLSRQEIIAAGKLPVLAYQYDEIRRMVDVLHEFWASCDDLRGFAFVDGATELTAIWEEGPTWCRARPDWLANNQRLIVDYKTTDSAAEDWARRSIIPHGLDVQCAWYSRGVKMLLDVEPAFVFLVQEVSPPYAVCAFGLDPAFRAIGEDKCNAGLRLWRACTTANEWPGYSSRIHWIQPTAYQMADAEEMSV